MLSEREKHGMAELLSRMASADLFSLAQTVTSRLLVPESPADAVAAIIQHTDRPVDLLKRRRVRKEFLFKYLHDKRVEGVEGSSEKAELISQVMQLWDASSCPIPLPGSSLSTVAAADEDSLPEAPAPSRNTSYSSLCSLDVYSSSAPIVNHLSRAMSGGGASSHPLPVHPPSLALILNRVHASASSSSLSSLNTHSEDALLDAPSSSSVPTAAASAAAAATGLSRSESNWSFMDDQDSGDNLLQLRCAEAAPPLQPAQAGLQQQQTDSGCHSASSLSPAPAVAAAASAPPPPSSSSSPFGARASVSSSSQVQQMADTFVKWYYDLLNVSSSSQPGKATSATSEFKSEHFFTDASANIQLLSANQGEPPQVVQVQNNGSEVCSALQDVVRRYALTYNPNLCQDGVQGVMDQHGLVVINACGTLHNVSSCCGIFHQQFGLIRDPFNQNNWKIKFTNARLMSRVVHELPTLSSLPPLLAKEHDSKATCENASGSEDPSQTSAMALC